MVPPICLGNARSVTAQCGFGWFVGSWLASTLIGSSAGCAAGPTDVLVTAATWETIGAAPFGKGLSTGLGEGVDWASPGKAGVVFGANAAAS
ncbi:MAG TPA: hypothetical protein DEF77_00475 [Gammaproteobacteria bacterium]|nr:hypothetical protein [Gammaproteobacteria bacterium]HBW99397.1 hypothetical protein [Gammaproteobacteria bacterium]